tara:strand:- start:11 stop:241 length:231 start_codon:yes stop_codon:yes gene_type:complete
MHTKEYLIKEGIFDDSKNYSRVFIARFYQEQLEKFEKIGLGRTTENDIIITPELVRVTRERLFQLKPILRITMKER